MFSLPVRDGESSFVVVARTGPPGVLLGYFFKGPPSMTVSAADACLVAMFGDRGISIGEWEYAGRVLSSESSRWPIPRFRRTSTASASDGLVKVVEYDDNLIERSVTDCSLMEASSLPKDGLFGYRAVERLLSVIDRS